MLNIYETTKHLLAKTCMHLLDSFVTDKNSPDYGTTGIPYKTLEQMNAFWTAGWIYAYYLEGEETYHNKRVMEAAYATIDNDRKFIHEDGSTDLLMTNFHDPSHAAFHVRDYYGPALEIMTMYSTHTEEEDRVYELLADSARKLSNAMKHLGFHTPNHRWIICSALSYAYKYLGDEEALETINKFLWEGIDCDENGEYTERSSGTYNQVCDASFLKMYHIWKDKKYLDCVDRNMKLMRSYYEPDMTICTMNSMRQDRGYTTTAETYWGIYIVMALYTGNPEYAYFSDKYLRNVQAEIIKSNGEFMFPYTVFAYWFLAEPDFIAKQEKIESYLPDRDLNIFLKESGIARLYNGNTTLTICRTNTPDFLKFQVGSSYMYARAAGSFFGDPHSQFRGQTIEKTDKGYVIKAEESAGYRSQFDEPPATSEWRHMDHSKRHILNVQHYNTTMTINPTEKGFTLDAEYGGVDNVPSKLEFEFVPGIRFEDDDISFTGTAGQYMYFKGGKLTLRYPDGSVYELSGGRADYYGCEKMRGAVPPPSTSFVLAMTCQTPGKIHLEMKKIK